MELGHTFVIRPGALGDSILTLPALHALRIAGATHLVVLGTVANWGFIRKAHTGLRVRDFAFSDWMALFQDGEATLGPSAQATLEQTDTAIVYLKDCDTVKASLHAAGVNNVICITPPVPVAGDDCVIGETAKPLHAARCLLDSLWPVTAGSSREAALQIVDQAQDCFLSIDEEERIAALDKLGLDAAPDGGFFAIHPGSGGRRKWWPVKNYARVAVELSCNYGYTPLVFFGPADEGLRDEFEAVMPPGIQWEAAENRPLREVLSLLCQSRGFLGNDSGLTHLAARACPTVAIFGPTDSRVWSPVGAQVRIIHAPDRVLDKLSVEEVMNAIPR
jgi:heptosyltransferase III